MQKNVDDDRIEMLERMIREASDTVMESERKYEEVQSFSLALCGINIYSVKQISFRLEQLLQ